MKALSYSSYGVFLITLFSLVSSGSAAGAYQADAADELMGWMKSGNSKEIAKLMAPSVEMTILTDENVYSKVQAEAVLKDFFLKHEPTSVKLVHKLTSNPNYRLTVVVLTTGNGMFRISYSMKSTGGSFLLTEMRIEVNKE